MPSVLTSLKSGLPKKSVLSRNEVDEPGEEGTDTGNLYNPTEVCNGDNMCNSEFIDKDLEDEMQVYGYRRRTASVLISWILTVVTLGVVRLVFHWWPHLMLYTTHYHCRLSEAEKLLVVENHGTAQYHYYVKNIKTLSTDILLREIQSGKLDIGDTSADVLMKIKGNKIPIPLSGGSYIELPFVRMFEFKKHKYIWNKGKFFKLKGLDNNISTDVLHQHEVLSFSEQLFRQFVYGSNVITVPVGGIIELLFLEVLNPFYIFQLLSFGLWFAYDYILYATAILIMSAGSIIMTVIQTRNDQTKLHSMVHSSNMVSVLRRSGGKEPVMSTIRTEQLVPGDLMLISNRGCTMHCDAVLLNGSCIVNESMLTGESVPVTKTPLPSSAATLYDDKEHAKHTLFCGTQVIKTRYCSSEHVYAVVIRTGFLTTKGNLVRSILYPTPVNFKFEQDSYKFVQLLAVLASVGFLYTVITKVIRGVPAITIALEALDLVTIVVPPALPAAMTVGCMYAQSRLKKNHIYCVSPRMINVSGSINCFCFDKTGTLTEDGLDVWGVIPSKGNYFGAPIKQADTLYADSLLYALATCHSLTIIDGQISGDPLDIKMFESTGWVLEEPDVSELGSAPIVVHPPEDLSKKGCRGIEIVCQYPFSSNLQRMSVITRQKESSYFTVYCKGSPEMIHSLCIPNTIPEKFKQQLEEYTKKGYRVLGLAKKYLPTDIGYSELKHVSRQEVEVRLSFLGFIVFENRLKPETTRVITALRAANIHTIMVTGDNQLTAVSVAKECGIIQPNQRVVMIDTVPSDDNPPKLHYKSYQHSSLTSDDQTLDGESLTNTKLTRDHYLLDDVLDYDSLDVPPSSEYCFVLTGAAWEAVNTHFPDKIAHIVSKGAVFSRMTSDHKQQLILALQSLGFYVGMCGDGANDCGALKAAHTGISLSEAEASVASPFTSRDPNIECVIKVIREGRAALVTSFGIFKYMAGYSLTQFICVMILYSMDSNLTDLQYLYIDLFIISTFAFLLGRTEAYPGPLAPQAPETSLVSLTPIVSLIGQIAIVAIVQFVSYFSLQSFKWFKPFDSTKAAGPGCYENYALFSISSMQYVILAVVFSKGAPYRLPLYKNWSLLATVTAITAFTFYLIVDPSKWFQEQFELVTPPDMHFRIFTIILCVINFVVAGIHEFFICDYLISGKLGSRHSKRSDASKKKAE